MTLLAVTAAERPDLWERSDEEITGVWPEYKVDREDGRAGYWEPNVWVRHRIR